MDLPGVLDVEAQQAAMIGLVALIVRGRAGIAQADGERAADGQLQQLLKRRRTYRRSDLQAGGKSGIERGTLRRELSRIEGREGARDVSRPASVVDVVLHVAAEAEAVDAAHPVHVLGQ